MCKICRHTATVFEPVRYASPGTIPLPLRRGTENIILSGRILLTPCCIADQTGPDDSAQARQVINGQTPMGAPGATQNGQYPNLPLPIDAANVDFAALGWETESFLASLNTGFMEGYQDSDLFC